MKKMIKAAAALMVISGFMSLGGCRKAPTNTSTSGLATIVCDASFQNIMDQEIDVFEYTTKGRAQYHSLLCFRKSLC